MGSAGESDAISWPALDLIGGPRDYLEYHAFSQLEKSSKFLQDQTAQHRAFQAWRLNTIPSV